MAGPTTIQSREYADSGSSQPTKLAGSEAPNINAHDHTAGVPTIPGCSYGWLDSESCVLGKRRKILYVDTRSNICSLVKLRVLPHVEGGK
jgi:hypothetical protein